MGAYQLQVWKLCQSPVMLAISCVLIQAAGQRVMSQFHQKSPPM